MKTYVAAALLLLCFFTRAYSQPKQCYSYDYLKAEKAIWTYLLRKDNFEIFSDDLSGREVFNDKQELYRKGTVIPIPVLRFEPSSIANGENLQLNSLFTTDHSHFIAFLMNRKELANIIVSSPQYPNSKRIESMGATDPETATIVYDLFKNKKICFFYDALRFRYAYFENNNYIYYDIEKRAMITLSASDYVADYKRYFNLK
ncbi:hypothetical protein [Hymenobacter sp. BRD67]|uniref:hypothetical protein n=1 Tax=Hymenobacter sp. BRD67 TaxID=2675877 RepID=UPI0015631FFE|nr:hypothetical protein [Hymenobacter sp. BRD67]QKG53113.1 hypothetical protein GKZ67_11515 [Hymenobacter sp. BRD67]